MLLVLTLAFVSAGRVVGQDSTAIRSSKNKKAIKYVYFHGMLGIALDAYTSKDIQGIITQGLTIRSLGFPFQYGIRGGFRNIAQFEYSRCSTSAHDIGSVTFMNGQIVPTTTVRMKLTENEYLFKINPAFWSWGKLNNKGIYRCLFVVWGASNVTYKDTTGDGFSGTGNILGLEMAGMSKYLSFSFGATYHTITYGSTRLLGIDIPTDFKASRFTMYVRMGLGLGV